MAQAILSEGAAPSTPSAGKVAIYAKTDGLVYSKDDAGTEQLLGTTNTPNAALNPDFDIAQRGTSFVSAVNATYDLDGWVTSKSSAAVTDVIQGTGPTTGSYSRQVTVTTADTSIAAGDTFLDHHRITGYDIVNFDLVGNTFTVAFWAKFPVTGIHCAVLKNSGADRSYVHEFNVTAANTWAEYQFTVEGGLPTAGTWNYTTGIGLRLQVTHACGSTYQTASVDQWVTGDYMGTANQVNDLATVGNVWAISKLRINKGTQPTSAATSRDEMIVRCQARHEPSAVNSAFNTLNDSIGGFAETAYRLRQKTTSFKVKKLYAPTVTLYSPSTGTSGKVRDITAAADVTAGVVQVGVNGFELSASATLTAGNEYNFHYAASSDI